MKSAGAVKHKLNQVRFRHQKKRIEAELRRVPGNCLYNATVPAPTLPSGFKVAGENGQMLDVGVPVPVADPNPVGLGICLHGAGDPTTWKPTFCDENIDGGARAKKCDLFCPRKSKEQVKEEFARELEGMTFAEVAYRYPDMAALVWVLDEDDLPTVPEEPQHPESAAEAPAPPVQVRNPEPPEARETTALAIPTARQVEPEPARPWWARWLGLGS